MPRTFGAFPARERKRRRIRNVLLGLFALYCYVYVLPGSAVGSSSGSTASFADQNVAGKGTLRDDKGFDYKNFEDKLEFMPKTKKEGNDDDVVAPRDKQHSLRGSDFGFEDEVPNERDNNDGDDWDLDNDDDIDNDKIKEDGGEEEEDLNWDWDDDDSDSEEGGDKEEDDNDDDDWDWDEGDDIDDGQDNDQAENDSVLRQDEESLEKDDDLADNDDEIDGAKDDEILFDDDEEWNWDDEEEDDKPNKDDNDDEVELDDSDGWDWEDSDEGDDEDDHDEDDEEDEYDDTDDTTIDSNNGAEEDANGINDNEWIKSSLDDIDDDFEETNAIVSETEEINSLSTNDNSQDGSKLIGVEEVKAERVTNGSKSEVQNAHDLNKSESREPFVGSEEKYEARNESVKKSYSEPAESSLLKDEEDDNNTWSTNDEKEDTESVENTMPEAEPESSSNAPQTQETGTTYTSNVEEEPTKHVSQDDVAMINQEYEKDTMSTHSKNSTNVDTEIADNDADSENIDSSAITTKTDLRGEDEVLSTLGTYAEHTVKETKSFQLEDEELALSPDPEALQNAQTSAQEKNETNVTEHQTLDSLKHLKDSKGREFPAVVVSEDLGRNPVNDSDVAEKSNSQEEMGKEMDGKDENKTSEDVHESNLNETELTTATETVESFIKEYEPVPAKKVDLESAKPQEKTSADIEKESTKNLEKTEASLETQVPLSISKTTPSKDGQAVTDASSEVDNVVLTRAEEETIPIPDTTEQGSTAVPDEQITSKVSDTDTDSTVEEETTKSLEATATITVGVVNTTAKGNNLDADAFNQSVVEDKNTVNQTKTEKKPVTAN